MDGSRQCLSLVLPAFNEQAGLRQALAEADQALARLGVEYEILLVDDGSTDDTPAIAAEEATRRPHLRILRHDRNLGYGAALRTGFEAARFDLVAFTDADCQFHLDDLGLMLPLTSQADIVAGYRIDRQDPARRIFLSRGYNLLARLLLGTTVRDIDCALKVYRRSALLQILPESAGFFANTEMLTLARQKELLVAEVGVRHRPRLRGQSTVSLREVPRTLRQLLPFWWSRVVFAGGQNLSALPSWSGLAQHLLLLLLVASLLFFTRLRAPLLEPQEVRYAEIPRQMLAAGQWLVPILHDQPYLDKPPLLYWSVMASYRLLGVQDTSARMLVGLIGVATVLVSYLWGRRFLGSGAALCGALVLCLMPEFVYRGRMLTFDALLGLWVVASLAAAHVACSGQRLRLGWWLLSALACALGLLTKGPVALVLTLVPLAAFTCLDTRLITPTWRAWTAYLACAVAVAGPWYAAVLWQHPEFAGYFFWRHNVVRFLAPFDHAKPLWYYLPVLLVLLPWSLLLPGLLRFLSHRSAKAAELRPGAVGFFLLSSAWMLLFFSLAGSKRPTYLLPALPPLALALGWYVHTGLDRWYRSCQLATAAGVLTFLSLVGVALLAAGLGLIRPPAGFALAGAGLGGLALLVLVGRRLSWSATAAIVFVGLYLGVRHLLPAYNDQFSLRGQLRRLASAAERGQRPVVCYPQRYDSTHFYLPASEVCVYSEQQQRELLAHLERHPGTLLVVKSGAVLQRLLRNLPESVQFQTQQQRGAITVGRVLPRRDERMLAAEE